MIDRVKIEECYLCGACIAACSQDAISFGRQVRDFTYPVIDASKCIDCQRCEAVCPALAGQETVSAAKEHKAWIAWNPDRQKRLSSTSGGVFIVLAEDMLARGGYVCGAVLDEAFQVKHMVSNRHEDVLRMMGSKYVQSDMTGVYEEIQALLDKNEDVLFSGCPCQVAALHSYLGKAYGKLSCVEVVCHGICGPKLWKEYLSLRERLHGRKVKSVAFRSKKNGWHESAVQMKFDNGKEYAEPYYRDAFAGSMVKNITLKDRCYDCQYKGFASGSDMTLGDFWGANVEVPELDDDLGLSAVVTHTDLAEAWLRALPLHLQQYDLQTFLKYNTGMVESAPVSPTREGFYQTAEKKGYAHAIKKHLFESRKSKFKRIVKNRLKNLMGRQ